MSNTDFEQALQRARIYAHQYEKVGPYLDETERRFKAEAYRAAIVMLWCAASARLNEDIERLGASGFLRSGYDSDMLHTYSRTLKVLTRNRANILKRCLGDRNDCAHPSDRVFSVDEIIGYLEDLNRALFSYPLSTAHYTFKVIVLSNDPLSPEQADFLISRLRINRRSRRLPHTLLENYFAPSPDPRVPEKTRLVWQMEPSAESEGAQERRLKEHLGLSKQEQAVVMSHLARKLRQSGNSHRPVEIAQLIFWEVLSDDDTSLEIYEYFPSQIEHLTVGLLRKLLENAPAGYKERIETAAALRALR